MNKLPMIITSIRLFNFIPSINTNIFTASIYIKPINGEAGSPPRPVSIIQLKILNITITTTFGSFNNRFIITNVTFFSSSEIKIITAF